MWAIRAAPALPAPSLPAQAGGGGTLLAYPGAAAGSLCTELSLALLIVLHDACLGQGGGRLTWRGGVTGRLGIQDQPSQLPRLTRKCV